MISFNFEQANNMLWRADASAGEGENAVRMIVAKVKGANMRMTDIRMEDNRVKVLPPTTPELFVLAKNALSYKARAEAAEAQCDRIRNKYEQEIADMTMGAHEREAAMQAALDEALQHISMLQAELADSRQRESLIQTMFDESKAYIITLQAQIGDLLDQLAHATPGAKKLTKAQQRKQWEDIAAIENGDELPKRTLTAMRKRGHLDADNRLTDAARVVLKAGEPPAPKPSGRESIKVVRKERDDLRARVETLNTLRDRIETIADDVESAAADDDWEHGYTFALESVRDLRGMARTVH